MTASPTFRSRPPSRQAFLEGITHVARVRSPFSPTLYDTSRPPSRSNLGTSNYFDSHPIPNQNHHTTYNNNNNDINDINNNHQHLHHNVTTNNIKNHNNNNTTTTTTTTGTNSININRNLHDIIFDDDDDNNQSKSWCDYDDDDFDDFHNNNIYGNGTNNHNNINNGSSSNRNSDFDEDNTDYDHILASGDLIGAGTHHHGLPVSDCFPKEDPHSESPMLLEVVRMLGRGSYAVVFLVRQVLYDPPSFDNNDGYDDEFVHHHNAAPFGLVDDDDDGDSSMPGPGPIIPGRVYGPEFALKCLCKRDLSSEQVQLQRLELTLHRSLPSHPNIVALNTAFETDEWLFLVMEYCPGQDLFFWLEQAKDHDDLDFAPTKLNTKQSSSLLSQSSFSHSFSDSTPHEPSLLSSTIASSLLGRRRLRLISRMFVQICDAVHAAHQSGISHRDIKPENFICVDTRARSPDSDRKVIVKLTDWGLATSEIECGDFDCGSKPYMAFECRNNVSPSYRPREADIWSMGIVLLNLLYHRCPWADPSFADRGFCAFVDNPVGFLCDNFNGITTEVAEFLATRVFCQDAQARVTAQEFGRWATRLVGLLGEGRVEPSDMNTQSAVPVLPSGPRPSRVNSPDLPPYPSFPQQYDTSSPKLRSSTLPVPAIMTATTNNYINNNSALDSNPSSTPITPVRLSYQISTLQPLPDSGTDSGNDERDDLIAHLDSRLKIDTNAANANANNNNNNNNNPVLVSSPMAHQDSAASTAVPSSALSTAIANHANSQLVIGENNNNNVDNDQQREQDDDKPTFEEGPANDLTTPSSPQSAVSRSNRRKRGARKGKRKARNGVTDGKEEPVGEEEILNDALAQVSQSLAREISQTTKQRQRSASMSAHNPKPPAVTTPAVKNSKASLLERMKGHLKNGNPDLEAFIERAKERDTLLANSAISSAPARLGGNNQTSSITSSTNSSADHHATSSAASTYSNSSSVGNSVSLFSSYSGSSYTSVENDDFSPPIEKFHSSHAKIKSSENYKKSEQFTKSPLSQPPQQDFQNNKESNINNDSNINNTGPSASKIFPSKKSSKAQLSGNWRQPEPDTTPKQQQRNAPSPVPEQNDAHDNTPVKKPSIQQQQQQQQQPASRRKGLARMLGRSFGGSRPNSRGQPSCETTTNNNINNLSNNQNYNTSSNSVTNSSNNINSNNNNNTSWSRRRTDSTSTLKSLASGGSTPTAMKIPTNN